VKIIDDICMISYLSQSGYTLTVILNFSDGSTVAIASNEKDWLPAQMRSSGQWTRIRTARCQPTSMRQRQRA
jgi:hypothetical protein